MLDTVYTIATWLVPLVIAIVFHEVAHGLVARMLGDPTAARLGRLSLNPIRHVDPFGTVILPMALAIASLPMFGWAKPVPVRRDRLRNPRWHMMLVALAGPGMNIALALIATGLLGGLIAINAGSLDAGVAEFIAQNLFNFVVINVFLAIFNLLPIPPFDGGHVVEGLLPRAAVPAWNRIGRLALPVLIILLVVLPMVSPQANVVLRYVGPVADIVIGWLFSLIQ
ncbi:site-2 protease family protein [Sphingomonas sp. FW199]|uniref:site-2 protease family protein n=1 Tax=Sphingomonas sp. FW199 TaxID=3400217 RepID=UPI003CF5B34B